MVRPAVEPLLSAAWLFSLEQEGTQDRKSRYNRERGTKAGIETLLQKTQVRACVQLWVSR